MNNINESGLPLISTSDFEVKDFTHLFLNESVKNNLEPWVIGALNKFDENIVVPPTFKQFQIGEYFRIEEHKRSICYNPFPAEYTSAICLKGCEVFSNDINENIKTLAKSGPTHSGMSHLEHFITIEKKVPACVTYTEAIEEALIAEEVQVKYIEAYGELAPLPLPIKVFKLPESICKDLNERFLTIASKKYYNDLKSLISHNGLAVYIYYYPNSPVRVKNLNSSMKLEHPRDRQNTLKSILGDPENVIHDWITLFARLLCIGYIPATTRSTFTGVLCDINNATIGGGYCDVGSVEKISSIYSERIILEAIQISLDTLCESILQFLVGANGRSRSTNTPLTYIKLWTYSKLCEDIKLNQRQFEINSVIKTFFDNTKSLDKMQDQFLLHF